MIIIIIIIMIIIIIIIIIIYQPFLEVTNVEIHLCSVSPRSTFKANYRQGTLQCCRQYIRSLGHWNRPLTRICSRNMGRSVHRFFTKYVQIKKKHLQKNHTRSSCRKGNNMVNRSTFTQSGALQRHPTSPQTVNLSTFMNVRTLNTPHWDSAIDNGARLKTVILCLIMYSTTVGSVHLRQYIGVAWPRGWARDQSN